MSTIKDTLGLHKKAREILSRHGCTLINGCAGPETIDKSWLEFWAVPSKGMVMLQLWDGNNGVTTYSTSGTGETWEDFERFLEVRCELNELKTKLKDA